MKMKTNTNLTTFFHRPVSILKWVKEKKEQKILFKGRLKDLKNHLPLDIAKDIWQETKKGNKINRFHFHENKVFEVTTCTCHLFSEFKINFNKN